MAGPTSAWDLTPDLIESQLAIVELIKAMYPPTAEDAENYPADEDIDRIRAWCDEPEHATSTTLPNSLNLTVTIPIEPEADYQETKGTSPMIQLNVTVPLKASQEKPVEPPQPVYTLRQPSWMSRAEVAELGAGLPTDDVLAAFDYVQETAPRYLQAGGQANGAQSTEQKPVPSGPLLRVWFYFPSLSTREKRRDLVNYAPRYRLTGFVLAGKPGVLCLEGTSRDVDDYMNAIKNESWGDIPSHQKKVSERFREECGDAGRKFGDMSEITDDLGEKRGARKNRGDMAALELFLKEKGVGESFSKVIMGT